MTRYHSIPIVTWDWKPWFAWYPIKLDDGKRCWLRKIERRRVWCVISFWEYRAREERT